MFNELNDDTHRRRRQLERSSAPPAAGRRSTSSASTTSSGRATSSRAASTSSRSPRRRPTPATCCSTTALTPEELFAPRNIGTAFRFNEETRPIDAYAGDQTTTSGYGMVDIALTARTRLIAGARVERFDQTVVTQDPFGLFAREIHGDQQEHRRVPGDQPRAGGRPELEPAPQLQHDGQPAGVPRAGRVRVHRRRRQPRGQRQPEPGRAR